jgi:hypothetical protein
MQKNSRATQQPAASQPNAKFHTSLQTQQFGVSLQFIKDNNNGEDIPPVVRQCVEFLSQPDGECVCVSVFVCECVCVCLCVSDSLQLFFQCKAAVSNGGCIITTRNLFPINPLTPELNPSALWQPAKIFYWGF